MRISSIYRDFVGVMADLRDSYDSLSDIERSALVAVLTGAGVALGAGRLVDLAEAVRPVADECLEVVMIAKGGA